MQEIAEGSLQYAEEQKKERIRLKAELKAVTAELAKEKGKESIAFIRSAKGGDEICRS